MFYLLQHGERSDKHLRFMYKPAIETLKNLGQSSVSVGNVVKVSEIPYNSTFIWVGVYNLHRVPWARIRARGAKTVYYQTEKVNSCTLTKSHVDEIWDYAWYNIEQCKGKRDAPLLRYVPIARQSWVPTLIPDIKAKTLEFFGKSGFRGCFKTIDNRWNVTTEYGVWNETGMSRFLRKSHGVFINIHKNCAHGGPVEGFRTSLILSAGGVIVSSRCHVLDEKMYEGFVLFVDDIRKINYEDVEHHLQHRNMSSFSEKFDANVILRSAGLKTR